MSLSNEDSTQSNFCIYTSSKGAPFMRCHLTHDGIQHKNKSNCGKVNEIFYLKNFEINSTQYLVCQFVRVRPELHE